MSPALVLVLFLTKVPAPFVGKVVGVSDGDTFTVMNEGTERKIGLNAVDCPDLQQDYGNQAKELTSAFVVGKEVRIEPKFVDRVGRILGEVVLSDGKSLSYELVRAGLARWNERRAPNYVKLKMLETEAKNAKVGLWSTPSPPPSVEKDPPNDYAAMCAIAGKYDAAKLASDPATMTSFAAELEKLPKSPAFRVTWAAVASAAPSDKWLLFHRGASEAGLRDFKCPALEKLWERAAPAP